MSTPLIKDGHIYGADSYGEFRCLDLQTGKRLWSTYKPITGKSTRWGNVFIVEQGNRVILFNELGELLIAKVSPKGYEEISRARILKPTTVHAGVRRAESPGYLVAPRLRRPVRPSHAATREIVCVSLAADGKVSPTGLRLALAARGAKRKPLVPIS